MNTTRRNLAIAAAGIVVLLLAFSVWYWLYRPSMPGVPNSNSAPANTLPDDTPDNQVIDVPTTTDPGVGTATTSLQTTKLPADLAGQINWYTPRPIARLGYLTSKNEFNYEEQSDYAQIGAFTYNGQPGRVILLTVPPDGMGPSTNMRLVEYGGQIILLSKYSETYYSDYGGSTSIWNPSLGSKLVVDTDFTLPLFDFPETITVKNDRQVLTKQSYIFFSPTITADKTAPVLLTDAAHGPLYTSTSTGAFYFVSPDGFTIIYTLQPDFFTHKENVSVPAITWNDGTVNTSEYGYTTRGGCGSSDFLSVVPPTDITIARDLKAAGKTSKGDTVYELKDANNKMLKDYYDNSYSPGRDGDKISYAEFVSMHPLVFWVDPFGRLVKLSKSELGSMAECGKPVIYLYPEKTTAVSVKVEPKGGLSYSDPEYNQGWNVVAEPNGALTEMKTGKTYPYLFWEGRGGLYQTPKTGFVVKKTEVESFLKEKLAYLGMNAKETADFLEFWLPRMQAKPYYFVTFLGTRQMDVLAPLTINPKPDTIVRILMDYTPLDRPISVEPENLGTTPKRSGFTVIEWGGVVR